MKKGLVAGLGCLAIVVVVVLILAFSAWGTYNSMITLQESVNSA